LGFEGAATAAPERGGGFIPKPFERRKIKNKVKGAVHNPHFCKSIRVVGSVKKRTLGLGKDPRTGPQGWVSR